MAVKADLGAGQGFAKHLHVPGAVVGVVACGALDFAIVERKNGVRSWRVEGMAVTTHGACYVLMGPVDAYRVVIGEVGADEPLIGDEIVPTGATERVDGNRTIMAGKAELRDTLGLARSCLERGAAVKRIGGCRHLMVPEGGIAHRGVSIVGSMADDADFTP